MRFLLFFLSLTCGVLGRDSSTSILKEANEGESSHKGKHRVVFSDERKVHTFEVRRYEKPWDRVLFLLDDIEEKIPSHIKASLFAVMGLFSLQHMLYNPIWWCQILAGRSCYVFVKRLLTLFKKLLTEVAQPQK